MRYLIYTIILFMNLLSNTESSAQWYESQGQAFINNGDKATARTLAMENAVKKALLVAGASVSSVQQVVNGLITHDELSIRASGTVNSIELVDESYSDDSVYITIRADIFSQDKQCAAADYKKSLLIPRGHLTNREQANIGEIYAIDQVTVTALAQHLNKDSRFLDAKVAVKNKTQFSRLNRSFQNDKIKDLSIELGHMFDTQYVLYSEISDVSFEQEALNKWQFWQEDIHHRHFAINLYLYSSINGELIIEKNYRNQATWPFGKREHIDLNSELFWQSDYGAMINRTLSSAIIDIDEGVMCQQTRAKIVQVNGNQIVINIGRNQGVQVGDKFTLLHLNNFKTEQGKIYSGFNISPYSVKVTEVFQNTAYASTTDQGLLGNIQVNDLAVKD